MVRIVLTLVLLNFGFLLSAQIQFLKIYSDVGFEKGEGITQLSDSSYLVTGSSTSFGDGPPQAFLMKLDSLGNHLWAKHYGGIEVNEGKRVFAIENYGYFVGGNTNSNVSADFNFYFVKTDMNGDPLFEKQVGTPAWDFVNDGIMLADSTFILTGETYNTPDGKEDAYTVRFKNNGDTLWTSQSHKPGIDKIYAAETVGDTAFVLAGTVWNEDSLAQKAFLGMYRYDKSIIWEKEYGITGDFEIKDIELWNNVLYCVGNRILIADSLHDEYVLRVNLLGDTLTSYSYLGSSDKSMNKLVKYGNTNNFYISISFIDQYSYGSGDDIFIAKYTDFFAYDYSGVQFKANGQDDVGDLIKTIDGGAILVGTNRSLGNGNANVFILKIGLNNSYPNTTSIPIVNSLVQIEEKEIVIGNNKIYPNPTKGILKVIENLPEGELRVINTLGQLKKSLLISNDTDTIDISDLESGFYHFQLVLKNGECYFLGKISKQQ